MGEKMKRINLNGYEQDFLKLLITCAINKHLRNQKLYYEWCEDYFHFNSDIRESNRNPCSFDKSYDYSFDYILNNTEFIKKILGNKYKCHYIKMINMNICEKLVYLGKIIVKKYKLTEYYISDKILNIGSSSVREDIINMANLSIKKKKLISYKEYEKLNIGEY